MLSLLVGCTGRPAPPGSATGPSLSGWAAGPVSWLLLPSERKRMRRVDSSVAAVYFIEEFWQRRDPDSEKPGNPVRATFNERVDAADQLYPEPGRRGSLTDRGGALILLGSPSHLHVTSRPVLNWDPRERRGERVTRERQSYEIWGYRLEELPKELMEVVRRRRGGDPVRLQLSFARGKERTYLVEGGELLELAARVLAGERFER
ncbi:MAG: GWxTD domain-containing protein [Thermoanaerobaculia bacterium]